MGDTAQKTGGAVTVVFVFLAVAVAGAILWFLLRRKQTPSSPSPSPPRPPPTPQKLPFVQTDVVRGVSYMDPPPLINVSGGSQKSCQETCADAGCFYANYLGDDGTGKSRCLGYTYAATKAPNTQCMTPLKGGVFMAPDVSQRPSDTCPPLGWFPFSCPVDATPSVFDTPQPVSADNSIQCATACAGKISGAKVSVYRTDTGTCDCYASWHGCVDSGKPYSAPAYAWSGPGERTSTGCVEETGKNIMPECPAEQPGTCTCSVNRRNPCPMTGIIHPRCNFCHYDIDKTNNCNPGYAPNILKQDCNCVLYTPPPGMGDSTCRVDPASQCQCECIKQVSD